MRVTHPRARVKLVFAAVFRNELEVYTRVVDEAMRYRAIALAAHRAQTRVLPLATIGPSLRPRRWRAPAFRCFVGPAPAAGTRQHEPRGTFLASRT